MKPILAVWLAVLALLCLWICLEPGSGAECSDEVVIESPAPENKVLPVAIASQPDALWDQAILAARVH